MSVPPSQWPLFLKIAAVVTFLAIMWGVTRVASAFSWYLVKGWGAWAGFALFGAIFIAAILYDRMKERARLRQSPPEL